MPVEQPIGPAFKGGPNGTLIYDILSPDCRDGKCAHLSQEDAREGRTCHKHPCTCREPQGEPSDARLLAALTAYETKAREQDGFPAMATPLNLTWFSEASTDRMRAALRAAGEVRS